MDNLVAVRVAQVLDGQLRGAVLSDLREEASSRFRLVFEGLERPASLLISLDPVRPWLGRPAVPRPRHDWSPGPFAQLAARTLVGSKIESVAKLGVDRIIQLAFSGGLRLVAELATHGANLVLVNAEGLVIAAGKHPRRAASRAAPGVPYGSPPLPQDRFVPFGRSASEIDRFLSMHEMTGENRFETLRRHVFGVGSAAARLVVEESALGGRSEGEVLEERLAGIDQGGLDPVIEGPADPLDAAENGRLDQGSITLLPWEPVRAKAELVLVRRFDAAATAGLYHDALERAIAIAQRLEALRTILRVEIRRLWDAGLRVKGDAASFQEPERYRRQGEALLAGLNKARRVGGRVFVPDPYGENCGEIELESDPAEPLTRAAEKLFQRSRKARRAIEAARVRGEKLEIQRRRLETLEAESSELTSSADAERLETSMRAAGVPVGLRAEGRAARDLARVERPKPAGVRILVSGEGIEILIGKTGRDNDRLTFKIAAPHDFWLHAAGHAGAHVVIRNPQRLARPPRTTLEEAAAAAAWFSEARDHGVVDVHWTPRKNVRRAKGAPSGTVTLKRFETVRVKPAMPSGMTGEGS